MAQSSSIHRINADPGPYLPGRFLWRLLNRLNNTYHPDRLADPGLEVLDFHPDTSPRAWDRLDPKSSPSRRLCDFFWIQLPWKKIADELSEIHVLDAGCGSGKYGERFQEFAEGRIKSYTGLDIAPQDGWKALASRNPGFAFEVADSARFTDSVPPSANLFVSQSAIEHFVEDLGYFRQIRDLLAQRAQPALQIHLFPSAACLRLYDLHGVRQYTPRTVSKITSLFSDFSDARLFNLGGGACNRLHFEFITRPVILEQGEDRRDLETDDYESRLRDAIAEDGKLPQNDPAFYALVIHSHPRGPLPIGIAAPAPSAP